MAIDRYAYRYCRVNIFRYTVSGKERELGEIGLNTVYEAILSACIINGLTLLPRFKAIFSVK